VGVKTIKKKKQKTGGLGEGGGIKIHIHKTIRSRRDSLWQWCGCLGKLSGTKTSSLNSSWPFI